MYHKMFGFVMKNLDGIEAKEKNEEPKTAAYEEMKMNHGFKFLSPFDT